MKDIGKRVRHLEKKINKWDSRLKGLDYNMRHYLKRRLPSQRKKAAAASHALAAVKRFNKTVGRQLVKTKSGKDRVIFMCSNNQARKLRAFADSDLRIGLAWKNLHGQGGSNGTNETDGAVNPQGARGTRDRQD